MAQPRKNTAARKPMPVPKMPKGPQDDGVRVEKRPLPAAPKPTLWQRIWYGAQAERKLAAQAMRTMVVGSPLAEVKAGVMAEMQNISRTQGGVSGSPFSNVMLPQTARAQLQAKPVAVAAKAPRRLPLVKIAVLAVALLLSYALWQGRQAQVAGVISKEPQGQELVAGPTAKPANPKVTVIEWAEPLPAKAAQGAGAVAVQPLASTALAKALPQQTPPAAMAVQNQKGVLWFSTGLMNATDKPLRNLKLKLEVRDNADVLLLARTLDVAGPVAAGAAVPPQRLALATTGRERFVAQVPMEAFKVSVMPVAAAQ